MRSTKSRISHRGGIPAASAPTVARSKSRLLVLIFLCLWIEAVDEDHIVGIELVSTDISR